MNTKKQLFSMSLMILLLAMSVQAFSIESPVQKRYDTDRITIEIEHDQILDSISYSIDNGQTKVLCTNCSNVTKTITLGEGSHVLRAYGTDGSINYVKRARFSIELPEEEALPFTLNIRVPESKTYLTNLINVKVISNVTLDKIEYEIDDIDKRCTNCSQLTGTLNLTDGTYTLRAKGTLDGEIITKSVTFKVNADRECEDEDDCDHEWNYSESHYGTGWNKLPQLLESGDITDEELAEIIRENKINPGIINRLIKTGQLGDESIDAILDTQFAPSGIFKKMFRFMLRNDEIAENIYRHYDISDEEMMQRLLERRDLRNEYKDELKERLKGKLKERMKIKSSDDDDSDDDNDTDDDSDEKSYFVGKQDTPKVPYGQAKKFQNADCEHDEEKCKLEREGKDNKGKGRSKNKGSDDD